MDQDFGLGLIDVADNFGSERQLVWRIANHDRILRIDLGQPPQIEKLAETGNNLRDLLRRNGIRQIEGLHLFVFYVPPFLGVVRRNENHAAAQRLPKRLAFERHIVEGLLERHIGQFDWYPARGEVWIENHTETSQLGNRFENHARVVRHLQIDRLVRHWLQLGRRRQKRFGLRSLGGIRGGRFWRRGGRFGSQRLHGFLDPLLGGLVGRSDARRFLEFA